MLAFLRKAPQDGAFFVMGLCLLLAAFPRLCPASRCEVPPLSDPQQVAGVIDGDTLRLGTGDVVRLIGIDTPELDHDGDVDRPYAREARAALSNLLKRAGWRVHLKPGVDRHDRYRRLLAHAYTAQDGNLSEALLREGLAYQAMVAPNLGHLACYREAEREARAAARGLWSEPVREAATLGERETGYRLLRGRVESARGRRHAVWLGLEGGLSVRVPWPVWRELSAEKPAACVSRRLELRGWIYSRKGRLRLNVSHPAAITWL